jgi:DNA-binding MarR family transcriptional regulator
MRMKHDPSDETVTAWARLVRAGQTVLEKFEAALKAADLPPLAWYDVLLELSRAEGGRLRPVELERRTLLAQYNTSRLIDRMAKAGLVERRPHPEDGRGQLVAITPEGRAMQKRVWRVYGPAIATHVGAKLRPAEAVELARLLQKLID